MKRVIELVRVSTESQAAEDRASIPTQRAINRRTAAQHGLTIIRSVEMSDVSGAAVLKAPEMQELLKLIENPEIVGVVAREFSRLMRPEDFTDYYILQVFCDTRTVLYLPEGPIDFSNKMGRMYGVMQAAWAGAQRLEFRETVWNHKEQKRRNGEFAQGRICLPFGVAYDPKRGKKGWSYTPEAEKVKEAFRLVLAGDTSYFSVAQKLGFQPVTLRNLLRNPIFTGVRVIDKKRDMSPRGLYPTKDGRQGDRRKIKRAPEEVIRVKVLEPLVSESDFNTVQRILDLKKEKSWRHIEGFEHRFTYNGFLTCRCGSTIYTKYRRDDYYVCRDRCGAKYMRRDRLDPRLDSMFASDLRSRDFLRSRLRELKRQRKAPDRDRLVAQVESLTNRRQRILDTYFEGVINATERDMRLAEIEREKAVAESLLSRRTDNDIDTKNLAVMFRAFAAFDALQRAQKRRLLNTLAPQIVVKDYEIDGISIVTGANRKAADSIGAEIRTWIPLRIAA